jgi:selenocysteine lyase/cysteine desulfurase
MASNRRTLIGNLFRFPFYAAAAKALPASSRQADASANPASASTPTTLPDKKSFNFSGTFLNAAFTHPLGIQGASGAQSFLDARMHGPTQSWPGNNPRNAAVKAFAGLINADPTEVAVVPSTMGGENMVVAALGLGPGAGVVTDAFHYDASLAMYGELQRHGVPVAVVVPRENRIDLDDIDARITKNTRLVAVSLIASVNGYEHDLKALCDIAHAKGALVYADIVQAAGAIPIDVKRSGVDFCCCGTYKWLMGEFGVAFLYVRPDRLDQLHRVQFGWRSFRGESHHVFPFDAPGPAIGDWTLGATTASHFEVGSPAWGALAASIASIAYIRDLGIDTIMAYRKPLLDRLQTEMPRLGFMQLTPASRGPIVAYAYKGAAAKFGPALDKAKIKVTLSENIMRISPSVYNDMEDIDRLLTTLKA